MRPGDLRRDFPVFRGGDADAVPGDLRRSFWWDHCLHGQGVYTTCLGCEDQAAADCRLAWGITVATAVAAVLAGCAYGLSRVLGG